MAKTRQTSALLKDELERVLGKYQKEDYLDTDPISVPHRYSRARDIEMSGFLSAMMAFGNVKSMLPAIDSAIGWLGPSPVGRLLELDEEALRRELIGFRYRWLGPEDIVAFLLCMRHAYLNNSGLEPLFAAGMNASSEHTWDGLHALLSGLREHVDAAELQRYGVRYLLPQPYGKGAYKRVHLFLRWMVRDDVIDFGLWNAAKPSQCIIPIDTHIARIASLLGLTNRKSRDGKMAQALTLELARLDPDDPTKYDFALTRLGILGACPRLPVEVTCEPCELRACCKYWL